MAFEDFTTYTEVDPNSDITVTSTKVDVDTSSDTCYVWKSKGADHFGDFEHLITVYMANTGTDAWNTARLWNVTDSSTPGGKLLVRLQKQTTAVRITLIDGTLANEDFGTINWDTPYYLTIERSGTTLTCKIYSDSARTSLLDTLSVVCNETTYEYVSAFHTTGVVTGYTENLDLQEAPATITTGVASNIAQTTVTLGGNLTDLGNDPTIDVSFEYGETAVYGSETTAEEKIATGAFTQDETGLTASTGYHFRAKAVSAYGTTYGSDAEFTTLSTAVAKRRKGFMYGMKPARVTKAGRVGI